MQEQLRHLLLVAQKHLDRIVIAVFIILLCAVIYSRGLEPDPIQKPTTPEPLEDPMPDEFPNPHYIQATYYRDANPDIASTSTLILLEYNPFDFRHASSNEQIERENTRKLADAQRLFDEGRFQECLNLCKEVIKQDPRKQATDLIAACEAALKGGGLPD